LRFIDEALSGSLEQVIGERGGVAELRHRTADDSSPVEFRVDFELNSETIGHYAFGVVGKNRSDYLLTHEECRVQHSNGHIDFFVVQDGRIDSSLDFQPFLSPNHLLLSGVSMTPQFLEVFLLISRMEFYNIIPEQMRRYLPPLPGYYLWRDGSNAAGIFRKIKKNRPEIASRIEDYMSRIIPELNNISVTEYGPVETVQFNQQNPVAEPWIFAAANMSDGTLRAFGVLLALFQGVDSETPPLSLVGIEEPESALHPAAAGVLFDSLNEASDFFQVVITSHSADLLDNDDVDPNSLRAVVLEEGRTIIGQVDQAGRAALAKHLFTGGELLRLGQLRPSKVSAENLKRASSPFFEVVLP
jgi:hypothetical protein